MLSPSFSCCFSLKVNSFRGIMSHNHSTKERQADLCEFKTSFVLKSKQQNINFDCNTKNKLEKRLGAERLRKSY